MMNYYKMGPGPYFVFYRPYHLCHIESLKWIARAHFYGGSLLQPDFGFRTNVIANAKKELKKGEMLDGIGGFCCYGMIENSAVNGSSGLPICLSEGKVLNRDIRKDDRISLDDVEWDERDEGVKLYQMALTAGNAAIT
jgi:predicted homoserine dehydrogenase-like protein